MKCNLLVHAARACSFIEAATVLTHSLRRRRAVVTADCYIMRYNVCNRMLPGSSKKDNIKMSSHV